MSTDEVDVMSGLVIVEKPGGDPFGVRYGLEYIELTPEHLLALRDGKCVAVDVENEYVVFLTLAPENRET